ncbi:MAG: hypothetical protein WCI76_02670 [bacterium]
MDNSVHLIPTPRDLDSYSKAYNVRNNTSEEDVYVAYHLNTSGDNFAPREVGLDLFVQNGDKGFKQTIDSCKEAGSGAVDVSNLGLKSDDENKTAFCDKKIYLAKLEEGKIIFYRYANNVSGTQKEIVTSMPVSIKAKRIIIVNSYELYSDKNQKTLSVMENI